MKTKYINDVPKEIKALSYLGSVNLDRQKQLEQRIATMTQEVYRLYDRQNTGILTSEESIKLERYLKELSSMQEELKILKSVNTEKSNFNLLFLIIPVAILFLIKGKK